MSGIFFSDVIFLWLPCMLLFFFFLLFFPFLSCLWLSRASPLRGGLS
ncbi:putative membrane protein [Escherichia coli 2731150]|nr:putative membrane protein [Escherichia coli 2762100]EMW88826.1 putative membrane protein [Escherichia coli 2731150]